MPYITIPVKPKEYQISFDDILNGMSESVFDRQTENTYDTRTVFRENTPPRLLERINVQALISELAQFNEKHKTLIEVKDKSTLYRSFKIPKRSGGLRQINAPLPDLMEALRELKFILEKKFYASYHTASFAYVPHRSTVHAVKRHQQNNSRWFLKLDFHDFFGSSTPEFIMAQLQNIFPFSEVILRSQGKIELEKALSLCFLHGGLPQGTPISPTLTNLFMIPIDHAISKEARCHSPHLCYTRYADDIIISSDLNFEEHELERVMGNSKARDLIVKNKNAKVYQLVIDNSVAAYKHDETTARISAKRWSESIDKEVEIKTCWVNDGNRDKIISQIDLFLQRDIPKTKVLSKVLDILKRFNAPFTLSNHKTRYGSRAGSNYNLGVILNNENKITVGHSRKKVFKTMIFSFMNDYTTNARQWQLDDIQHLYGLLSYYRMVEGEVIDAILKTYSEKFQKDVEKTIKAALKVAV